MTMADDYEDLTGGRRVMPKQTVGFFVGGADNEINVEIDEALDAPFPPYISLPSIWAAYGNDGEGGPAVTDPMIVRITIPGLSADPESCEGPSWDFSLAGMVEELLDSEMNQNTGVIEGKVERDVCAKVATAFRDLADRIDRVLAKTEDDHG